MKMNGCAIILLCLYSVSVCLCVWCCWNCTLEKQVGFFCRASEPTWCGVGSSQHVLHLVDGLLPAATAGLHVRLQLAQTLADLQVTLVSQLCGLAGHHQLLQVVLQDDHSVVSTAKVKECKCTANTSFVCVLLAEQSLEVQLQASDGGVKGVQLSALLSRSARSVGARGPKVGLEMSVEVVAALHLVQAAVQGVLQGFGHCADGTMQQRWRRSGGLPLCLTLL